MRQQEPTNGRSAPSRVVPPPFRCTSTPSGAGAVQISAEGELDLASAPVLREALHDAQASARLIVLDLGELTFIDSAGLHVLEDSARGALDEGRRLVLARVPAHTVRVLEVCGLTPTPLEVLDLVPSYGAEPRRSPS